LGFAVIDNNVLWSLLKGACSVSDHILFLGLGYVAQRLAASLLAAGWQVSGTCRNIADKQVDERINLLGFDGHQRLVDTAALGTVTHIVHSIPPAEAGDVVVQQHDDLVALMPGLRWFGYLSTTGVYGDRQGGAVTEDDAPKPASGRAMRRVTAERQWRDYFHGTAVSYQIFRLAGIYGPGRNVLRQLKNREARIIDRPGQVFSRIHVDDIVSAIRASMVKPQDGGIYNLADDLPSASGDVIRYGAALLGMTPPPAIAFEDAELSAMALSFYAQCRRVIAAKTKAELGWQPHYPSYREGLQAIYDGC
jgi:nucleoside-diphosphate-sugar epimerase